MTHFYSAASHTKKAYKELLFKIAALSMSCLMTLLLLTGCSAKHPITPEEFTSIAEEQGYSVQDVTESTTSTYNVESYLSASIIPLFFAIMSSLGIRKALWNFIIA